MSNALLVYPMLALVLLSAFMLVELFRRRLRAVRDGVVPARFFGVYRGAREPADAAKAARHFSNLFEAPTLFYTGCITATALRS